MNRSVPSPLEATHGRDWCAPSKLQIVEHWSISPWLENPKLKFCLFSSEEIFRSWIQKIKVWHQKHYKRFWPLVLRLKKKKAKVTSSRSNLQKISIFPQWQPSKMHASFAANAKWIASWHHVGIRFAAVPVVQNWLNVRFARRLATFWKFSACRSPFTFLTRYLRLSHGASKLQILKFFCMVISIYIFHTISRAVRWSVAASNFKSFPYGDIYLHFSHNISGCQIGRSSFKANTFTIYSLHYFSWISHISMQTYAVAQKEHLLDTKSLIEFNLWIANK